MTTPDNHALLLRKFVADVLPCNMVQVYMPLLDLVPSSAEGAEIEHKDSHNRLNLQQPIADKIAMYSALAAKVEAALALQLHAGPEPAEIVAMVTSQFGQTVHIGATVVIAHLLEQGYLQLGPKASGQPAKVVSGV